MSEFVLQIREPLWTEHLPDLQSLVSQTLGALSARHPWPGKEVCIVFSNDAEVHRLNSKYRGQDKPTNVLSFPAQAETGELSKDDLLPLGDIVLGLETIQKEAKEQAKTLMDHASHLLIHGTLHLLGYDHDEAGQAAKMEALEVEILAELTISNPYEELAS